MPGSEESAVIKKKETRFFGRFTPCDCAALAAFVCLFACLAYIAGRGLCPVDESFYYTIVHRQMLGDRLFIDEWHVSQLSSLLQYLPFFLFTKITGSTEGVILFARYLYLAVDGILYWFLYARLRRYGAAAAAAICVFCSCAPLMILTLNYYTMSLHGTVVLCALLLFGKDKKSVPTLMLVGLVWACMVLAEPLLAVSFVLWTAAVLLRRAERKKEKQRLAAWEPCLGGRTWLWVTLGVAAAFLAFCVYLFTRGSPADMLAAVPELFTDTEYQFGIGQSSLIDTAKVGAVFSFFGFIPLFGEYALAVPVLFLKKRGKLSGCRRMLFAAACLLLIAGCVTAAVILLRGGYPTVPFYCYFQYAPILPFALNCCLLRSEPDRRVFGFWLAAFVYSVLIDVSSDLMFGLGGVIGAFPMLISFRAVVKELRERGAEAAPREGKGRFTRLPAAARRLLAPLAALTLAVFACWNGANLYILRFVPAIETLYNPEKNAAVDTVLARGPLKGIRTTERHSEVYNGVLEDLDALRALTDGPLYVTERCSYYYLYAGLPYACYSTWYVEADSETRVLRYWELHPEKAPAAVYIPFCDAYTYSENGNPENGRDGNLIEKKLAFVNRHFNCEIREGRAGYLVLTKGFHS